MYVTGTAECGVVLYTVSMILSFECDLKFIVTHSLNAGLHIILAAEHWALGPTFIFHNLLSVDTL